MTYGFLLSRCNLLQSNNNCYESGYKKFIRDVKRSISIIRSTIFMSVSWTYPLSQIPPRSTRSFSIAIGCCVPYVSTLGMFMSSINMIIFLPSGGPYVSYTHQPQNDFFCKNPPPKISCISLVLVLGPRLIFDSYIYIYLGFLLHGILN